MLVLDWPTPFHKLVQIWSAARFLKGKFSSGIEGALASTLNRNFNWKQLSEMILCIFLFIWVILIKKHEKKKKKKKNIWILGVGVALYYDLKYNH